MKYFFTLVFLMALVIGCKQKVLSGAKLESKLIETMQNYLDKGPHPGSVVFKVKNVSFYGEKKKKYYICEFHVDMHTDKMDTTGIMTAIIPNDFSKVQRTQ
jgi:hypothetical protein